MKDPRLSKVCSSDTQDELLKLIKDYYFSENYIIENGDVVNTKTLLIVGIVINRRKRFTFYN